MINLLLISTLFVFQGPETKTLDPAEISKKLDELYRSKSSYAVVEMTVLNPRYQRTLKMEIWSLGMDHTLVKILSPKKERGTATLKKGTEMWNYLPKIRKLIRIPPSMMMSSWMGSDFTNDDLVKESSWETDYNISNGSPEGDLESLIFIPKPDAAVTWGKVVLIWDPATDLPVRQDFFDEKGVKVREMHFEDTVDLGGRMLPSKLVLIPLTKEGHKTTITYESIDFKVELDESFFSKSQVRK